MRASLRSITAALALLVGTAFADPLTYVLEAETGNRGGTLTGEIVWDDSAAGPTLGNAISFLFTYTAGMPGSPSSFFVDETGVILNDRMSFTGDLGDMMLVPEDAPNPAGNPLWFVRTAASTPLFTQSIFFFDLGTTVPHWRALETGLLIPSLADGSDTKSPMDWKLTLKTAPEPNTFLLFGAAAAVIGWRRIRRGF